MAGLTLPSASLYLLSHNSLDKVWRIALIDKLGVCLPNTLLLLWPLFCSAALQFRALYQDGKVTTLCWWCRFMNGTIEGNGIHSEAEAAALVQNVKFSGAQRRTNI